MEATMFKQMTVAAFALTMMAGGVMAAECEALDPPPGKDAYWVSETVEGDVQYSAGGNSGIVNGTQTITTVCVAYNKGGNPKEDYPIVTLESTSIKICGQGKDSEGNPYPECTP
jgi:hypothetical protein